MKYIKLHLSITTSICLLAISFLSGCAFSDARLNLNYTPQTGAKSPLSTVKPLTIALTVEDQRDASERDRVGDKKNNFGMITAKMLSQKEPAVVIYDALKTELENNGHKVSNGAGAGANVSVKIALKKMWTSFNIHITEVEIIATINSDVAIANPPGAAVSFSKSIIGTYHESRQIALDSTYEKALNGALTEFVHNLAYDPGMLKALQSANTK